MSYHDMLKEMKDVQHHILHMSLELLGITPHDVPGEITAHGAAVNLEELFEMTSHAGYIMY